MTLFLTPHISTPCRAIDRIEVEASRLGRWLMLHYVLVGDVNDVKGLTDAADTVGERLDALWRMTCFEAFLGPADDSSYLELNLAPNGNWAAYAFTDTRQGMAIADITPQSIVAESAAGLFTLNARIDLGDALPDSQLRCALSSVVQTLDGVTSYWALAHPLAKPDFHHPAGFAHSL